MSNPFYDLAMPLLAEPGYASNQMRELTELRKRYAYAIPTPTALTMIARRARKLIEIGAGTGYWAKCLSELGVDIVCMDRKPWAEIHYPVEVGDIAELRKAFEREPDRSLFICFPGKNNPMAHDALRAFMDRGGERFVYVGSLGSACGSYLCGDEAFSLLVRDHWKRFKEVGVWEWIGSPVACTVYRRKH